MTHIFPGGGSVKPRVMTSQSSVNFPKVELKTSKNSEKHDKKRVMRAVFAALSTMLSTKSSKVLFLPEPTRLTIHSTALVCSHRQPVRKGPGLPDNKQRQAAGVFTVLAPRTWTPSQTQFEPEVTTTTSSPCQRRSIHHKLEVGKGGLLVYYASEDSR